MKRAILVATGLAAAIVSGLAGCGGSVIDTAAEAELKAALGKATITVYPAFVRNGSESGQHDDSCATIAAELIGEHGLGDPTIRLEHVPLSGRPGSNQAALLRESLAAFSTYVRAKPPGTDYALLAECLVDRRGRPIGVHLYVVDAEGCCAYATGMNSHHKPFNDAKLKSAADCTKLLIETMAIDLKPTASAAATK